MKFKVGDNVKIVNLKDTDILYNISLLGREEIIESIDKTQRLCYHLLPCHFYFKDENLELVEPKENTYSHCGNDTKKQSKGNLVTKEKTETIKRRFGHPDFYKLLEQMAELHSRKNHDYCGTKEPLKNLKASLRIGVKPFVGVALRLQDKWSRLESFLNFGDFLVKDENVEDTLIDIAIYSLLAIILLRDEKKNETR